VKSSVSEPHEFFEDPDENFDRVSVVQHSKQDVANKQWHLRLC
jgi:hypothetical protein